MSCHVVRGRLRSFVSIVALFFFPLFFSKVGTHKTTALPRSCCYTGSFGLAGSDVFGDGMAEDNRPLSLPKRDLAPPTPPPPKGLRLRSLRESGGRSSALCGGEDPGEPFGVVSTTTGPAGISVGEMVERFDVDFSRSRTAMVNGELSACHFVECVNGSSNLMVLDRER